MKTTNKQAGAGITGDTHLCFLSGMLREKFDYQGGGNPCPFCSREELSEILDEDGPIVWVKNKFPTFADTYPTVLIETDNCDENMFTYDRDTMRKVISFGIDHWLAMEKSGEYKSVVFYKNHGPLSGGTLDHAHMQIIGLKNIDYRQSLNDGMFEGLEIYREADCLLNLSTRPRAVSTEFNVIVSPRNDIFLADQIQIIVKYLLNQWPSFNLFFYQWKESIICKIFSRYVTSPFLIGFSIPQISDRLETIAEKLRKAYDET